MRIAIIGGSGFVGTALLRNLSKDAGLDLINIDKRRSKDFPELTRIGNVLSAPFLTDALRGADAVVLLAAEHRDDVTPTSLYYDVNVRGMKNTLEAMKRNSIQHLIFTSSVAVYGLDKENPDESFPAEPFNHYGKSKWKAEEVLMEWQETHPDWNIHIVRPTVIFGEGNRGNVYNLLNQIASGKFMMIGSGKNQKSMAYIGNIVAFLQFLLKKKEGFQVYNYVDKPDFTTRDLVRQTGEVMGRKIPALRIPYALGMLGGYGFDLLAWMTGKKLKVSSVRIRKFCAVTQYDASKAMASGFEAPFSMEEGLRRTLQTEFMNKDHD